MKRILPLLCAVLLAGCGGGEESQPAQPQLMQGGQSKSSSAVGATRADYYQMVQHIYVAYFGRPADPAGLDYFADGFLAAGAHTDLKTTAGMYGSHASVKGLIEIFSGSAESQALYPGDNSVFIDAVYANLFNRAPDQAGKDYWIDALNKGHMTRANAAVIIMSSALAEDATLIQRKVQAASTFTTSADTTAERSAYSGLAANAVVRTMLSGITLATDMATVQATVDATLANLTASAVPTFAQVREVIQQRCVACHSASPKMPGYNVLGIRYDTENQIRSDKLRIYQSVTTQYMPFGNATGMTDAEREMIRVWYEAGGN